MTLIQCIGGLLSLHRARSALELTRFHLDVCIAERDYTPRVHALASDFLRQL